MNAGPNARSDFHVVGNIFDRVYPGGNVSQVIEGVQTYTVPTGGGAVFELEFARGHAGTGNYAFVTHAFADASKGAVGVIQVVVPRGYRLGRSAADPHLAAIVEPFLPPAEHRCIMGRTKCRDDAPCGAHFRWKAVKDTAHSFFAELTVADLLTAAPQPGLSSGAFSPR
jgi:hypothetical protein